MGIIGVVVQGDFRSLDYRSSREMKREFTVQGLGIMFYVLAHTPLSKHCSIVSHLGTPKKEIPGSKKVSAAGKVFAWSQPLTLSESMNGFSENWVSEEGSVETWAVPTSFPGNDTVTLIKYTPQHVVQLRRPSNYHGLGFEAYRFVVQVCVVCSVPTGMRANGRL